MASWTNATRAEPTWTASTKGVLRPGETARVANLRRDAAVSPGLAPFVEHYWSVRWDLTGRPAYRSEVLSHPSVNLSVESGTHPRFGVELPAALVHGVVTRRFTIDLVGAGRVTAAKFRPGGFVALTGTRPPSNTVRHAGAELRLHPAGIVRQVLAGEDDGARAAVLDAELARLAPEPEPEYLDLLALLEQMRTDRSLVRVDQVAAAAGTSVRSVQRLFASYVGVGPKSVLARYRLHDAVAAIDAGACDLAALAASLGWFDQPHFARDFRAVVGTTPSAYRAQARRLAEPDGSTSAAERPG